MHVKSWLIQTLDSSARESKSARFCQALMRAWQTHASRAGSVAQSSVRTAPCDHRRLTRRPRKLSTEPVLESRLTDGRVVARGHERALSELPAEVQRVGICDH